ncbi:uncharacterized protein [Palaemon carinicauda]|uniref:uncharacterized protein n=1 Tax=Palaemon carinicauda TaxID=392227 RepID=UPI0035B5B0E2
MQEEGYTLSSRNSNSLELRKIMEAEGSLVEHNCIEEKVLGYRYNVNSDTLSLAPYNVEAAADTKRKVLSQISKVFDPLNFTFPVQHFGTGTTLNFLREQGFWIPKGLVAVKPEIRNCIVCQKYNALAYKYPKVVDMPKHHVNLVKPFDHVGIDYTGHFWVKDEISGGTVKMVFLVFTCLNIRAVHLELLLHMSTRNFILAFQRFCNMYSIPQYLYSDNAKTFIKEGNILETSLKSNEFLDEMEKCQIKHIRIPLYSAWVGAAWERLIRVLKGCLYKVIGRARLTYFELMTTISNVKLANEEDVWRDEQHSSSLDKAFNTQEEELNNFKTTWYENYLLGLREHSRNVYQNKWENKIKVGDIVLVKAVDKARPFWMMGRVLELVYGFASKARTVKLKQVNGAIEYHSISNLYPMEISISQAKTPTPTNVNGNCNNGVVGRPQEQNEGNNSRSIHPNPSSRPKRKATDRFLKIMRNDIDDL